MKNRGSRSQEGNESEEWIGDDGRLEDASDSEEAQIRDQKDRDGKKDCDTNSNSQHKFHDPNISKSNAIHFRSRMSCRSSFLRDVPPSRVHHHSSTIAKADEFFSSFYKPFPDTR